MSDRPIIAFSGSRDFTDRAAVTGIFVRLNRAFPQGFEVAVGDAREGLDRIVWSLVRSLFGGLGITLRREVCHWPSDPSTKQERWMAAHERNGRVVHGATMLLAFYGPHGATPGTTDAIHQANDLDIETHVYHQHLGSWS
jgi:hypothetical protein